MVVRSNANPPIDENNPEDAVGLLSYLKREQYGSWPIVYGHYFNAKLDNKDPYLDGNPIYAKDEKKGKYVVIDKRENTIPNYAKRHKTIFPRMWSNTQSRHANGYRSWAGLSKTNKDKTPTFSQNLSFFFKYQIGWSYLRYFMWNFAGRSNPILAKGIVDHLGFDLGDVTIRTFSDGELWVKFEENIRGNDVFIIQSTCGPAENLIELFLLLDAGMMGVFLSLDFFLFYIFWEVMLLPMYFLIGMWGGPQRHYAAIKFFLYTLFGSVC